MILITSLNTNILRFSLLATICAFIAMPLLSFAANDYTNSAHGDNTGGVTGRAAGYAIGNCAHCHDQHASREGNSHTPYPAIRGLAEENLCEDCHDSGGPAYDDIQSQINKSYGHTYLDDAGYSGRHTISATLEIGQGGTPFRSTKRHVECCDCHEPHLIGDGDVLHSVKTNLIAGSAPLQGVWGVEPGSEPTWGVANKTYNDVNPATKEYQICFKCHSYYGLNDSDGVTASTGPSSQTITDQGMEFSDNLRSFHPVRQGLATSTYTNALASTQTNSTWNSLGTQTMYCSDCHGADDELSGGAKGPHGSARKYMLKGSRQYWPASSSTGVLWSLADIRDVDKANDGQGFNGNTRVRNELFCLNCHDGFGSPASTNQDTWINNVHSNHENRTYSPDGTNNHNLYCIACHSVIPHGTKRSSLIVYDNRDTKYGSDTEPYRYVSGGNTFAALSGFKKQAHTSYSKTDCWSTMSGCSKHGTDSGGYEDDTP